MLDEYAGASEHHLGPFFLFSSLDAQNLATTFAAPCRAGKPQLAGHGRLQGGSHKTAHCVVRRVENAAWLQSSEFAKTLSKPAKLRSQLHTLTLPAQR